MLKMSAKISGIEDYFPKRAVTNDDLSKIVETTDEWIQTRTGIKERRFSEPHETPSFMGIKAAEKLLDRLRVDPLSIDLIIVATITGDYIFPATASLIQRGLGCHRAFGFDLAAACSGYLFAADTARAYIESGLAQKVLLVAAEKMTTIVDPLDRQTCILFGDAGSATLLERADADEKSMILDSLLRLDGTGVESLYIPAGGSHQPFTAEIFQNRKNFAKQDGRVVYKRAVMEMSNIAEEILKKNNLSTEDVQLFVPHQANLRIIESAAARLNLPMDRVAVNIDYYGNTTAATIPTALLHAERKGQVKKGDLVLLASFGAGFTWGSMLLKY